MHPGAMHPWLQTELCKHLTEFISQIFVAGCWAISGAVSGKNAMNKHSGTEQPFSYQGAMHLKLQCEYQQ